MEPECTDTFRQQFSFEKTPLQTPNGGWVRLDRDAYLPWVVSARAPYHFHGYYCDAIYPLKDGRYIHAEFVSTLDPVSNQNRVIRCENPDKFLEVDATFVVNFLQQQQFEIPQCLESALESPPQYAAAPKQEPRPISYWADQSFFSIARRSVSDVRLIELLEAIQDASIRAVQEIRTWSTSTSGNRGWLATFKLASLLFEHFHVDPENWWGSRKVVPPKSIDILKFRWPSGIIEVKTEVIPALQKLIDVPANVYFSFRMPVASELFPTDAEIKQAEEQLMNDLGKIETLTVQLTATMHDLATGKIHQRLDAEAPTADKPPKPLELAAYILKLEGLKVKEIKQRLGLFVDKGTMSRMIKNARLWDEKGNPTPRSLDEIPKFTGKPLPVDPVKLDLGQHQEGRPKRQRHKADD